MGTRIKYFIIIGMILVIGGLVIATDIDKVKIDKIKLEDGTTEYRIYKLVEVTTDKKIEEDKIELEKNMKFYINEMLSECISGCPDWCQIEAEMLNITYNSDCIEECSFRCELEKEYLIKQTDNKITKLNEILKTK